MKKVVISFLETDRPGIVAGVSKILSENGCNIEDVSQTRLQTEFAGIFIASVPKTLRTEDLLESLEKDLKSFGLHVQLKPLEPLEEESRPSPPEPFVITTVGADRLGLVAGISEVMARFNVNITNMKAVFRGGEDPSRNTMIYQVDVPRDRPLKDFRRALHEKAKTLGLELSMQHRDIFEAINRI